MPLFELGNARVAVAQQVTNAKRLAVAGNESAPDLSLNPSNPVCHIRSNPWGWH
jgi:hypothetical protein